MGVCAVNIYASLRNSVLEIARVFMNLYFKYHHSQRNDRMWELLVDSESTVKRNERKVKANGNLQDGKVFSTMCSLYFLCKKCW